MLARSSVIVLGMFALFASALPGTVQERVARLPEGDFKRLQALIKPQPGESPWRRVAWLTNITAARRRAVAEDKPLIIFTAADGSPLCRT